MTVTYHPLHRSVHAALPHTALALGRDDQTLVRVRVADAWGWQPMSNELVHALPTQVFGLAAAAQRAVPQPAHLESQGLHTCPVAGHGEVAALTSHHRAQVVVRPKASRCALRQTPPGAPQKDAGPPGFRARCLRACAGSVTARGPCLPRQCGRHGVAFGVSPPPRHPGHPEPLGSGHGLRSSIPGLHVPLSTLRPHPHGCTRMTRGRRSWLSLQRMKLPFTTPCRF